MLSKDNIFHTVDPLWIDTMVRAEIEDWLKEAEVDLKHAKDCLGLQSYHWACFAAQQSAEKALKGLIMGLVRKRPTHVHDLIRLYDEAKGELSLPEEVLEHLGELSSYYTLSRYPNAGLTRPSLGISRVQAERAVNLAEMVLEAVKNVYRSADQT